MAQITSEMLVEAAAALALKGCNPDVLLDAQNLPTYLTDEQGVVVFANDACEQLAGRAPVVGMDRWCVTWKLYTDAGEFLPLDQCPMAVAIREQRAICDARLIAERPDGTRIPFRAFPTPLFGRSGRLCGAVNVLIPS